MKGERAGHTEESGMWRQEQVLAARGELFRERESSGHKHADVQRQKGLHFIVLPSLSRNRRSQTSSILL